MELFHMKTVKLLIGLVVIALTILSCEKENQVVPSIKKSFIYQEFPSNLNILAKCVYFIDDKIGFAGGNGIICKTIDGGLTWETDSVSNLTFYSIFFVNKNIGFAVGGQSSIGGTGGKIPGSIVFKTINAGMTWQKLNIPNTSYELHSVFFINENIGFAIGLGLPIKTTDGGETWEQFEFEYKGMMKKITFIDSQTGFAAGLFGNIFRTSNQGASWTLTDNASDGHIYDSYFVGDTIGYACGGKEMIKTTDGGKSWNILKNSPDGVYFLHFADENNGIAIGYGHYTGGCYGTMTSAIYRTENGGETWDIEDNIEFGYIASFYSKTDGFSVTPYKTFKISYK